MRTLLPIFLLLTACGESAPEPGRAPVEMLIDDANLFLEDRAFRRASLERSLWQPELPYAAARLDAYGLERGGWDALPETVGADLVPAQTPTTREGWMALGARVFWEMPMRWDGYLAWVGTRPDLWDELGFQTDVDGNIRGLVAFTDARGVARTGLTCGACHGAQGVSGRANRDLDLGRARALFLEERGLETAPFDRWGPGRVDVTDDDVDDPLSFPNLFGVGHHRNLNRSGAIDVDGNPFAVAIRFETQYIEGHSFLGRPDRRLPLALAIFVMSLADRAEPASMDAPGAEAFGRVCGGCHDPDRGMSGGLVPAEALTSDPLAAFSRKRGTGYYKVPSLLGVADGGPYLHDGSAASLAEVLDAGHPFGKPLTADDRAAVLEFLSTLRSQP